MRKERLPLAEDVSIHIFTVSAALLGVCITVIGLLRVMFSIKQVDTISDDIVAADAVIFLVTCLTSYWALRTRNEVRMHRIERIADSLFLVGLTLMAVACLFITYSIASA